MVNRRALQSQRKWVGVGFEGAVREDCKRTPILYIFYGVVMAMTGYKDTMARVFLETALAEKHMGISVLDSTWANIHLCRVIRRLDDVEAAEKMYVSS